MSLDSLPRASQQQIEAMQREAEKRMKAEGLVVEQEPLLRQGSEGQAVLIEQSTPELARSVADNVETTEVLVETPPQVEQQLVENQPQSEPAPEVPKESNKERNMRILRERAERVERERNEALKRLQQLEQERLLQSYQQPHKPAPQHEIIRVAPDDLLEGKHLDPIQKELSEVKQALQQQQQYNAQVLAGTRLRTQFPDWDKVVTKDNLALLEELEPEIAQSINSNPDLYTTGTSAYKIIKQLGIYVEDTYQMDKQKAQKNAAKPKSIATIAPQSGQSPLSQANAFAQGLTPELQKQLRQEMENARRNM